MQEQQQIKQSYYKQIKANYNQALVLLEELKKEKEENANRNPKEI